MSIFETLGQVALVTIGTGAFIALNFLCYYYPTRMALRGAGHPKLPLQYYLRGFAGMFIACVGIALAIGYVTGRF